MAFEKYCNYNSLLPILVAHCYLPAINKVETDSNEDDDGDYD